MPPSSIFTTPLAQPRKRARILTRIALALAMFAAAGLFNAAHATFPGDNGVIVFDAWSSTGVKTIKRVSPGSSAVTDLAPGRYPSVSPNGQKIAFVGPRNDIYVMNVDGSNIVQLTNDQVSSFPAWLPDGSKLAYTRIAGTTQPVNLWTMNPDGTGKTFVRTLPITGGIGTVGLAWSPSGNIYTFNGDGINIANDLSPTIGKLAKDGSGSSWAPDGQRVLFHDSLGKQYEINPDGSNRKNVPSTGAISGSSAISPDGKFIASAVAGPGGNPQLTISNRAGTSTTFSWPIDASKIEWSRAPSNCYATTPQGDSWILAGDVNFHSEQCAIAVMPGKSLFGRVMTQVIAIGSDQRLYHRMYKAAVPSQGDPGGWTDFVLVPGAGGNPNGINAKKIAIAATKDGSAQVVIINAADNLVYHAMRNASGNWSGFTALDGAGGAPNFAARDVAIAIGSSTSDSPGNAQIIANGLAAGDLYHRVRWPDGTWTSFQPISPNGVTTHALAIAIGPNSYADVLATVTAADGSQGRIMHVLRYAAGNWTDWVTVNIPPEITLSASSDVAVTNTLGNFAIWPQVPQQAQMIFTDSTGKAFFQEHTSSSDSSSWELNNTTTQITTTTGRAVSISAGADPGSDSQLLITRTSPQ